MSGGYIDGDDVEYFAMPLSPTSGAPHAAHAMFGGRMMTAAPAQRQVGFIVHHRRLKTSGPELTVDELRSLAGPEGKPRVAPQNRSLVGGGLDLIKDRVGKLMGGGCCIVLHG